MKNKTNSKRKALGHASSKSHTHVKNVCVHPNGTQHKIHKRKGLKRA